MKALVVGGGTGGHIYPALAVMEEIERRSEGKDKICYLGARGEISADFSPYRDKGWQFATIRIKGISRDSPLRALKALLLLPVGFLQALALLCRLRPDVIYGTGSYVSLPAVLWGELFGIPAIIHEFNARPSLTNRLLAPFASLIAVSSKEGSTGLRDKGERIEQIPTPVRKAIREGEKDKDSEIDQGAGGLQLDLEGKGKVVSVFGGSHGSKTILEEVLSTLEKDGELTEKCRFILQTGRKNFRWAKEKSQRIRADKVRVIDYIDRMALAYRASDLVICRGGASTIAELTVTKTPAIIVPWSGAAGDHQCHNARLLEEKGAAISVEEDEWSSFPLSQKLRELLFHGGRLDEMKNSFSNCDRGAEEIVTNMKKINSKGAKK